MRDEELAVFAGEDVVGDGGDGVLRAQGLAEGQHEGRLAGTDGAVDITMLVSVVASPFSSGNQKMANVLYLPADAYGEGAFTPVAAFADGHFPADITARTVEDFVRVAMVASDVGMRNAIVGVRGHCCDRNTWIPAWNVQGAKVILLACDDSGVYAGQTMQARRV